ncbi:MAG: VCBS repeat-containing protein [Chitinophagaceae bacterium]|nr:VCBS repeat-containing protein [Chitinophagaceae bacterium]
MIKAKYLVLLVLLVSCADQQHEKYEDEILAHKYCGNCHVFPEPKFLNKEAWRLDVLPAMAKKLGIDYIYETQLDEKNVILNLEEWKKVAAYYIHESPDSLPGQNRPPVSQFTSLFKVRRLSNSNGVRPSVSYVGIDDDNRWIFAADALDSTLTIYNSSLIKISSRRVNGVLVDLSFNNQSRSGIFTLIGIMPPNDFSTGSVDSFYINERGEIEKIREIITGLPRPVATIPFRYTPGGEPYYVVSGFGNNNGGLYLVTPADSANAQVLNPSAGAIRAHTGDFNRDGIGDIIALTAQSRESIDIYYGRTGEGFDSANVLRFPPIYGSTYFELADFNSDGYTDILYTCGDNADYTGKTLKYYHGIYIFLNDGHNQFRERYFFPQHGAIKAIARDFDGDGDLDIASISFFPDLDKQPGESFVYLENKGNFSFTPYTVDAYSEGRWMTIDAGDIDGDGDDDIILGSMILPSSTAANAQTTSLLLLENNIIL